MSAPRFCPSCGRPVPLENSFCAWCGTPMTPMAAPPPVAPPPSAPSALPAQPPGGAPPPPAPYPYGAPPPTYVLPRRANAGSLISGTLDTWVKNFGPYFVVYLVLGLVTGGLSLLGSYLILGIPFVTVGPVSFSVPSGAALAAFVGYELLVAGVTWVFTSIVVGGVVDFSVRRYRGENVRLMESFSRGVQRVLSIMGANLLVTVIIFGVVILWVAVLLLGAFSIVAVGGAGVAAVLGALLAFPFVLVFVLYLAIALSLYAPAIMMEGSHAIDSLGRSWNLTRGHKWSILGAGLVVGLLAALIGGIIGGLGGIGANPVVQLVATSIASAITGAWFTILTAVAYDLITKMPQPTVWPPTYTPPVAYPPR